MKSFYRFVLLAALCLTPWWSRGVLMVPLTVEELTQRAELVLHGTVLRQDCLRDSAGRIYTRIEFQVAEVWKGNLATNTFIIVHGGGTVGDERVEVDGQAAYAAGEELVAFVRLNPRGEGVSIGLAQGKFTVWKDPATGEPFAYNLFHGQPKERDNPEQAALRSAAGSPTRLDLATLRARVNGGSR
jgi:hypothetical protein